MTPTRRTNPPLPQPERGRLLSRPFAAEAVPAEAGLHTLEHNGQQVALVYVPPGYEATRPAPFVVLLHGAGGTAQGGLGIGQGFADDLGMIILAPVAQRQTWDRITGTYGLDVARIDWALGELFARYNVDVARLAIGGFSDGASYALSLGLTNGDLFSHIIAFSPGFAAPAAQRGTPPLFLSHGVGDSVLPIDRCSRVLAPRLRAAGYDVIYEEFDGRHTVPPAIARRAFAWFVHG